MEQHLDIHIKQTQGLLMSANIEQSLKILKANQAELEEIIDEALLENPLLTISESYYSWNKNQFKDNKQDYMNSIPDQKTEEENLTVFLLTQLHTYPKKLTKNQEIIANYIIYSLDSKGYFDYDIHDLQGLLNVSNSDILIALNIVKSFQPKGIASRNIYECLSSQTQEDDVRLIINTYLQDVALNNLKLISKKTGFSISYIKECIDIIKKMNPIPTRGYSTKSDNRYINPDVEIIESMDAFNIRWLKNKTNYVMIDPNYLKYIKLKKSLDKNSDSVDKLLDKARHILQSIERRESTLELLIKEIIKRQEEFFHKGKLYLIPLTMSEIAEELEVHESTISRAVSGKYIECKWGSYELKYFFSKKIKKHSKVNGFGLNPQELIKKLVKEEDKQKPLSDEKISCKMKSLGISISRRTVTKYREQLKIPSSKGRIQW